MKKFRNTGRIIAILLILAMLLPCIGMPAFSADIPCAEEGCSGKYDNGICTADVSHYEAAIAENGVYQIGNAGQLFWFAALVNAGANEYGSGDNGEVYNAFLTADIAIPAGQTWTPMGLYSGAREYVRYSGTFDGAGHTISGLSYNNTAYTGRTAAFVGCLDSNGTLKNLTLADASINGATDIGGIAAHNYGTVSGCTVSGSVSGTGTTGGIVSRNMDGGKVENCVNTAAVSGAVSGGIAGQNAAQVSGCDNSGIVSGTNSVGGIVGINSGVVEDALNTAAVTGANTHVGGVAGNHIGGQILRCGNSGTVTGASDYVGGVAGVCSGASITESFNTGTVTGTGNSEAVGGVVGAVDGTNLAAAAITSCYNTGNVSGRSWVGGIAGLSGYQKTPETVTITGSYNTGAVTGTTYIGAVVGAMNKGTVTGTYYLSGCAANSISGASEATAEQFASGEIAYTMNASANVWHQNLDVPYSKADASPVLDATHGVVYQGYKNCTETGYTNRADHDVPGDHVDADGDNVCDLCGVCGEVVAVNEQTGENYSILDAALRAAAEGQTVKLLRNTREACVMVTPGVTLDLNGFELTTDYVVGFDTAHVIDSAGSGRLVAAQDNVVLDNGNAMIPVYDGTGYIFTQAGFAISRDDQYQGDGIRIKALACPVSMEAVALLADGAADNNIRIMIVLSWDGENGTGSQEFVYNDDFVAGVFSSNKGTWTKYGQMFTLVITGAENIENLQANIVVVSGTNAAYGTTPKAIN